MGRDEKGKVAIKRESGKEMVKGEELVLSIQASELNLQSVL